MTDNKSITPYNRLKELLRNDEIRERFDAILRDRAPAFLGSLLNIVSQDGKLQECEPVSVLNCAMKAAVFGLPIEPQLGFAWIIPPWNGKARKLIANFQFGYKGLVQLALQTGLYRSINAGEVYEGEQVTQDRISGMITITGERSGNGVLGYFAYIELMTGFRHLEYWELAAVYAELLNITDPVKVGISDLENPNKRDGHYRPRGRYKHPDALAVEADAEAATREMNELIDRYEAGEPLLDLVLNAQERQTMCDDALTYIHLLAEDDNCGCRPDRASECLFCRMKARYQEWLRRRNANQEA